MQRVFHGDGHRRAETELNPSQGAASRPHGRFIQDLHHRAPGSVLGPERPSGWLKSRPHLPYVQQLGSPVCDLTSVRCAVA